MKPATLSRRGFLRAAGFTTCTVLFGGGLLVAKPQHIIPYYICDTLLGHEAPIVEQWRAAFQPRWAEHDLIFQPIVIRSPAFLSKHLCTLYPDAPAYYLERITQ